MAGVNKVILLGHLGKDPEVKKLDSGKSVANFSLATSEVYKNKEGEKVTNTEWHNIVLWRGLAEVAEKYLNKGDKILIEGRIRSRSWEDKESGQMRFITEVLADQMQMIGSVKKSSEDYNVAQKPSKSFIEESPIEQDDLPF